VRRAYPADAFRETLFHSLVVYVPADQRLRDYVDGNLFRAFDALRRGALKCISARLVDRATERLVEKLNFEFFHGHDDAAVDLAQFDSCITRISGSPYVGSEPRMALKFVLLFLVDSAPSERIDGLVLANDEALWHTNDGALLAASGVADRAPVLTSDAGVCVRMAMRHSAT